MKINHTEISIKFIKMNNSNSDFLSIMNAVMELRNVAADLDNQQVESNINAINVLIRTMISNPIRHNNEDMRVLLDAHIADHPRLPRAQEEERVIRAVPPTAAQFVGATRTLEEIRRPDGTWQRVLRDIRLSDGTWKRVIRRNKNIGQTKFEAQCAEDCAICMQRHTNGESLITDCGHVFGSQCFETWIINPNGNRSCPTCRKVLPSLVCFTLRPQILQQTRELEAPV